MLSRYIYAAYVDIDKDPNYPIYYAGPFIRKANKKNDQRVASNMTRGLRWFYSDVIAHTGRYARCGIRKVIFNLKVPWSGTGIFT